MKRLDPTVYEYTTKEYGYEYSIRCDPKMQAALEAAEKQRRLNELKVVTVGSDGLRRSPDGGIMRLYDRLRNTEGKP
jgi:hypothetical protein